MGSHMESSVLMELKMDEEDEEEILDCDYFPADDFYLGNFSNDINLMDYLASEFEIIPLNPSVNYESESECEMELDPTIQAPVTDDCLKEESLSNSIVVAGNDTVLISDTLNTCDNNNCNQIDICDPVKSVVVENSMEVTLEDSIKSTLVDSIENVKQDTKKVKKKLNLQQYKQLRGNPHMTCSLKDVKDTLLEELKSNGTMLTSLPPIPLPNLLNGGFSGENLVKSENRERFEDKQTLDNPENYEEIIIVSMSCQTELSIPHDQDCPVAEDDELEIKDGSRTLKNIVDDLKKDHKENLLFSHTTLLASIQNIVTNNKKQTPPASAPCSLQEKVQCKDQEEEHGEDKIIMHLRKDRARPEQRTIETQTINLLQFPPLNNLLIKRGNNNKNNTMQRNYRGKRGSDDEARDSRSRSKSAGRNYRSIRQRKNSQRNKSISSSMYSSETDSDYSSSRRRRSRSRSSSVSSYTSTDSSSSSGSSSSSSYDRDRSRRGQRRRNYSFRSNHSHYSSRSNYSRRTRSRSRDSYYRRRSNSRRSTSSGRYYYSERPRRSISRQSTARNNNNNNSSNNNNNKVINVDPDNRNVIYVGHVEAETTKADLRKKFTTYGPISKITIHFKDTGMKYGFITYQKVEHAYAAIDSSAKDSNISHYDVSFGGRRAFCRADYCDLDAIPDNSNRDALVEPNSVAPANGPSIANDGELSFEALLALTKQKLSERQKTS